MLDLAGFGPTVLFSCLSPQTRIPAHSSVTNVRLVVHLPLIVPGKCYFRVGNETREWRYGKPGSSMTRSSTRLGMTVISCA